VLQEVRVSSLVWLYVCANLSCFHRFLSQVDAGELDPVTALGDDDTEDVVLVQTEFVWPEGAARDVKLCGDWNNFLPIQMYSEGGTSHGLPILFRTFLTLLVAQYQSCRNLIHSVF